MSPWVMIRWHWVSFSIEFYPASSVSVWMVEPGGNGTARL
jgi:hypothetical protein